MLEEIECIQSANRACLMTYKYRVSTGILFCTSSAHRFGDLILYQEEASQFCVKPGNAVLVNLILRYSSQDPALVVPKRRWGKISLSFKHDWHDISALDLLATYRQQVNVIMGSQPPIVCLNHFRPFWPI
jgi:hypothetical protein